MGKEPVQVKLYLSISIAKKRGMYGEDTESDSAYLTLGPGLRIPVRCNGAAGPYVALDSFLDEQAEELGGVPGDLGGRIVRYVRADFKVGLHLPIESGEYRVGNVMVDVTRHEESGCVVISMRAVTLASVRRVWGSLSQGLYRPRTGDMPLSGGCHGGDARDSNMPMHVDVPSRQVSGQPRDVAKNVGRDAYVGALDDVPNKPHFGVIYSGELVDRSN
ncbi:MAG TPA: hypothetical protein VN420_04250 [Candidatus Fimivivens sp.]|nr:hypothetical protein [Candidatus Fimivivens sp.]